MEAFLLLSNNPIRSSITMTWPSLVFSSSTVFIFSHFGRSWKGKTTERNKHQQRKRNIFRSHEAASSFTSVVLSKK